jgi:hypothetical protein
MDGYINTISTDKAKLSKMPNNRRIYICGKWEYDKRPPGHTPLPDIKPPIMK